MASGRWVSAMAELIIALTNDGVGRFRLGGGCQSMGKISIHSYPEEGENGDPCTCGETRRGEPVDDGS